MITLRKSYEEFKNIYNAKGIQPFLGNSSTAAYHVLAIDGDVIYETYVTKNNSEEHEDFIQNIFPTLENRKSFSPVWDEIQVSFPTTSSEQHNYYFDGFLVQVVTTQYEDASKRQILSVTRIVPWCTSLTLLQLI